jgi:hypothetical protein
MTRRGPDPPGARPRHANGEPESCDLRPFRLTHLRQNGIDSASLAQIRHVAQGLERRLDTAEVGGSIPPVPTTCDELGARSHGGFVCAGRIVRPGRMTRTVRPLHAREIVDSDCDTAMTRLRS